MTLVKRLRLLTAVLGAAAASAVVGTSVFGDIRGSRATTPAASPAVASATAEDAGRTKFSDRPTLTYKTRAGSTAFAWQVKPTLPPAAERDRDILVMVDTSASQAGSPLQRARYIIDGLAAAARAGDKINVWTVNVNDDAATRSLTGGFQAGNSAAVRSAAARLVEVEYAAGATDLKVGIEKAVASFAPDAGRQQVILFLGDGESAASALPFTESVRLEVGQKLEAANVSFFAVPLGIKVNPHNLHGLAALTGGAVVRVADDLGTPTGRAAFATKLTATFAVPVLRPEKVQFGAEVAETFPTKLPPLRADRATLVVGTLKGEAANVTANITGKLAGGADHTLTLAERLPVAEMDNYFLHAMIEQWKTAPATDAPAILAADRSLALASQQFRLFREEFLSQAVYAVSSARLDHAEKLYQAASKIDPSSQEAAAGLQVVHKLRSGELTPDKLRQNFKSAEKLRADLANGKITAQPPAGGAPPAPGAPPAAMAPATPPAGATDASRLQQAQAERQVQEQQFRVLVDDTVRRSRQMLSTDPNGAYEALKRQRDIVLANAQLGDAFRARLAADLEAAMQTVNSQGAAILATAAAERERISRTRLRINEYERQQTMEEQIRARINAFKVLMSQARYELAQQEAQILIQERIANGGRFAADLPEAVAAYRIGQSATNLREHRELVRIREDRYLLTMLQVEKSYIPYPDEPPVHFPPAAVWRELTSSRIEKYSSASLGSDIPPSMRRIQSIIDGPNAERVKIEAELDTLPLRDIITQIEKEHGLKIVVLEDAFKAAGVQAILDTKPTIKQRLTGLTVGAFLDIVLQSVNATYVVRPEYIEITTIDNRLSEKVVRAFDVTDLVYQIPQSVNPASLYQNLQLQGQNLAVFGQATFAGGFGAIGGLGLGGFAALGGQLGGQLGGGQLGGGALGGAAGLAGGGLGALGMQGGALGGGNGGGVAGFGGGQAGQFGNLGGQFGIQGNSAATYDLLMTLITEVVARGEWANINSQLQNNRQPGQVVDEQQKILPENQLNSIGPFQPTRSLIVRGTTKYHPTSSFKLKKSENAALGGPGLPRGAVAQGGAGAGAGGNGNVVGDVGKLLGKADAAAPGIVNPRVDVADQRKGIDDTDPTRMWQQAMDKVNLSDPRFIVAAADLFIDENNPTHAAEILKAGIRRGIASEVWAHDALALALRESKATPAEIERATYSAIDLEPGDAGAYLKAAKAADEAKKPDVALAFCQRAANLDPTRPVSYANALVYAERATEVKTDAIHWATENLLRRDWPADGVDYHAQTKAKLDGIVRKFEAAGQAGAVERVKKSIENEKQRDLVIELLWQGTADLDLIVTEPSGAKATASQPRTSGGGVLKADILEQGNDRSEMYAAGSAFSGTYTVAVKTALGRAIGNRATVQVTRFKGTDREQIEVFSVDLTKPQPISIKLDGGSRNELVSLPAIRANDNGVEADRPDFATTAPKGFGGGAGTTGGMTGASKSQMPTLIEPLETKIPGVSPSAPGMRAVASVSPDRKTVTVSANPVFGGTATDLPMPKVSLLPGSDR